MPTLTQIKRNMYPVRYALKDKRTKVYRVLYGPSTTPDRGGLPETNLTRHFEQEWSYSKADQIFHSLASMYDGKGRLVSNGLFKPGRYIQLVRRLESLRNWKQAEDAA